MKNKKEQKHRKHPELARAGYGLFGRTELTILGTSCNNIKHLTCELIKRLSFRYNLAYMDAAHKGTEEPEVPHPALASGAQIVSADKPGFKQFDINGSVNDFQMKSFLGNQDLVLVNGNHFSTQKQIVVIDPEKSLERELEKLTDIQLILLQEEADRIPEYLEKHLGATDQIPVFRIEETEKITGFLDQFIAKSRPRVSGLVLAGGRSTRMHTDKGLLTYHGKPHRNYLCDLLSEFCEQVYLSYRPDQIHEIPGGFDTIPDSFLGLGPLGAILSAFRRDPDSAWLVLACDLPLLSHKTLRFLTGHRNPSKTATAFRSPSNEFPEPLITIWEPKSYPSLLHFLSLGYSCPRKVLINSDTELLQAPYPEELKNVNTPGEYETVMKVLADND